MIPIWDKTVDESCPMTKQAFNLSRFLALMLNCLKPGTFSRKFAGY